MRAFVGSALIAGLALLATSAGYPQSNRPATPKPSVGQSPSTAAPEPGPKSIQRVESKEQLGHWKGSQIIGAKVEDLTGKNVGKIEDVMVDASGRVTFAVLSFGGFLGFGDKWYAVPWGALQIERDRENRDVERIVLHVTKETLERAPSFSRDRWPDARNGQWARDTQKYWSDTSITMAVKSKLAGEKLATLTKVDVDTREGVVELTGTVDSTATKDRATQLARQVDGVRRVVNNLKVKAT
jgi:sporulation protein YlmC with PRC-barrel domain